MNFFLAAADAFLLLHLPRPLAMNFFLAAADAFLLTTLPRLFLMRSLAVRPLAVFSLVPRSTTDLAWLPLAILLTRFFFMAFMAAAFMAFMTFIAFAIAGERKKLKRDRRRREFRNL